MGLEQATVSSTLIEYQHQTRKDVLAERVNRDLYTMGIDRSVVNQIEPIVVYDKQGVEQLAGLSVKIVSGNVDVSTEIFYEIEFTDGANRMWDFRAIFIPTSYKVNGKEIVLPVEVATLGYQVLAKDYGADREQTIRIDTACATSMFVGGHSATAHNHEIGCDCDVQRNMALSIINKSGGLSILTPFLGRGNGLRAHGMQLTQQAHAARYGEQIPDTYEAVVRAGFPEDSRPQFYPLDTAIFQAFNTPDLVVLLSNNPDKADAIKALGIEVRNKPIHVTGKDTYYYGINYRSKVNGHGENPTNGHIPYLNGDSEF